ncbi:hypothetical protein RJD24_11495 [Bacillaceae bacterium IKA-2]|nr:hypothetical protein RJD24_11495 [Bacillaceae bacterium IKA-2]
MKNMYLKRRRQTDDKQKAVITVESYDEELNRYSKSEYVIISRN